MRRPFLLIALVVASFLILRSLPAGFASTYLDPLGQIIAQDEALYASTSIHMAQSGDWLTPMFLNRPALYKPPLLPWLAAASVKLFGISRTPLRLPAAILCGLAAGLIFLWIAELASWQCALCGVALLAASRLFTIVGAACLTDGLLVAFFIAAMYALFSDPWLESRAAFWTFAGAVAASVLTKSIAGILPLMVLVLYSVTAPSKYKPALSRVALVALAAAGLVAPWYAWQFAAHPRWFWTDHFLVEIFGYGTGAPPQTSHENRFAFYLLRLPLTDPVLVALALAGVPAFFAALRKRTPEASLLACWIIVVLASVFGWSYRNLTYLLPLFPALAIVAMAYGPFAKMTPAWWMFPLTAAAIALKFIAPLSPWGIPTAPSHVPAAPALTAYCELHRGNDLLIIDPDDELFAADLPLPRIRYVWRGEPPQAGRYALDFADMGITLSVAQFDDLPKLRPAFRRKLREWGVDADPIGTVIYYPDPAQIASLVAAHPNSDFLLPHDAAPAATHLLVNEPDGHVLMLSRDPKPAPAPAWTCNP